MPCSQWLGERRQFGASRRPRCATALSIRSRQSLTARFPPVPNPSPAGAGNRYLNDVSAGNFGPRHWPRRKIRCRLHPTSALRPHVDRFRGQRHIGIPDGVFFCDQQTSALSAGVCGVRPGLGWGCGAGGSRAESRLVSGKTIGAEYKYIYRHLFRCLYIYIYIYI